MEVFKDKIQSGMILTAGPNPPSPLLPFADYMVQANRDGSLFVEAAHKLGASEFHNLDYIYDGMLQDYDNVGDWIDLKYPEIDRPEDMEYAEHRFNMIKELEKRLEREKDIINFGRAATRAGIDPAKFSRAYRDYQKGGIGTDHAGSLLRILKAYEGEKG